MAFGLWLITKKTKNKIQNKKYLPLALVYLHAMIKTFGDKETEKIWFGIASRKLPSEIQHVARRKLRMINSAQNLKDLRIPPANFLEKLSGNLAGFYSIRINKQWRIIFAWENDNAFTVQIVDYH
jgi:proteic killer suppression protein